MIEHVRTMRKPHATRKGTPQPGVARTRPRVGPAGPPAARVRSILAGGIVRRTPIRTPVQIGPTLAAAPGLSDLAFSLKPPKFIRKAATAVKKAVTLKNVLKVGAVVGAAALIPGALPLLAKGAVGAGKLAIGAGKLAVRGAKGLAKGGASYLVPRPKVGKNNMPVFDAGQAVVDAVTNATASAETPAAPPVPMSTSTDPFAYGGTAGGGGGSSLPSTPATASDPASEASTAGPGPGSLLIPLAIGTVALLAMSRRSRPRRA